MSSLRDRDGCRREVLPRMRPEEVGHESQQHDCIRSGPGSAGRLRRARPGEGVCRCSPRPGRVVVSALGAATRAQGLLPAVACGAWAILERARRGSYRERVKAVLGRSQVARHFRDSILESLPETVVVLRFRSQRAFSYGGGSALLQQCLEGPDAAPLAGAINDLLKRAAGFSLSVRVSSLRQIFVRGLRIGNGAALFLRTQERYSAKETVGSATPRIVPFPVAIPLGGEPGPGPIEDKTNEGTGNEGTGNVQPIRASREGEIVIGADGHLKQYNRAFAMQWSLSDDELCGEPLWADVAERCIARNGRDSIWEIVSCAAIAAEPERLNEWGAMIREGGARISLSVARLKDGATRMTFIDAALPSETAPYSTTVMAA